ncbi:hypothetical protein [Mycobacteroides abscessus]|uniref:hypothetical protein n=1 Tax=Mycobacteroides abscessus TaxID=36809 RepID=UPI0012FFD8AD|nr:hypothetical protein [Mycobacteroides abscessus]
MIECASLIYDEGLQHGAAQIARNRGGLGKFLANPLLSTKSRAASSRRATRPPDSFEIRTPQEIPRKCAQQNDEDRREAI